MQNESGGLQMRSTLAQKPDRWYNLIIETLR